MAPIFHPFTHSNPWRAPKRSLRVALFFLFLAVAWYLVEANAVIASSYRLSDALADREKLGRELETLRGLVAQAMTPEAMEKRASELGFVPVDRASYLPVPGTTVAVR